MTTRNADITIITYDGDLSRLEMPVSDVELLSVSADMHGFSEGDEKKIFLFASMISVSGTDFPLDERRLAELERVGARTTRMEDVAIARWLLGIKKLIEEVRR